MTRLLYTLPCLAACFGAGPTPTAPTEATILLAFDLPPESENCRTMRYIHQVALGPDVGYAVTSTFLPPCNNGSSGNSSEALPVNVFQFAKRGGTSDGMMIGAAGTNAEGDPKSRVAAVGSDAVWAFAPPQDNKVHVASKTAAISATIQPGNSANAPFGIVSDATTTYIVTSTNLPGTTDANHPRFPCCGSSTQGPPPQSGFFKFPNAVSASASAMPVTPAIRCEQMKDCLVGNSSALFYVERGAPPIVAAVSMLRKTASTAERVGMIAEPPVGLAADEARVAWATSINFADFSDSPNTDARNACAIYVSTTTAPHQTKLLLQTGQFSCMDVALDGDYVYFTIVRIATGAFDATVTGLGIGRIAIDTSATETLDLGITSPAAGPRHLFIDGDNVITVAPFVVASFRKAALEGREDFQL